MTRVLLAAAAGLLFGLALPPFDHEWLAWFSLAPLLVAAHRLRPLLAMGLGLVAGFACAALHLGVPAGSGGLIYALMPFLWVAMLLGVVAVVAAAVRLGVADPVAPAGSRTGTGVRRAWATSWRVLLVACAGVAGEWLTVFLPLPLNIAISQYRSLYVIQIASLTGIWGVSFLLWWLNAALADACLRERALTVPLALSAAALAVSVTYSAVVLAGSKSADTPVLRVAAVQDYQAVETAALLGRSATEGPEVDREALTRDAVARGAKLVVWSEGCLGAAFAPDARINPTRDLARQLKCYLVVGYSESARPLPFNCAAIVSPSGGVEGVHRKIHLFLGERHTTRPGTRAAAFDTGLGRLGMAICFDTCYTGVPRRIAAAGARLIAMPNYDPPTPRGILHLLHAAVLPFRAIENAVPFVRADPNGCSQIVDGTGRIRGQSPLFAADCLVGDLPLGQGTGTLFTLLGDWFAYLCLAYLSAVGIYGLWTARVSKRPAPGTEPRGSASGPGPGKQPRA